MNVRPRPALAAALAAAAVLNVLTRVSDVAWLALASGAALALPLTSLVLRPRVDQLRAVLVLPSRAVVGEAVEGELRVTASARSGAPAVMWELDHPGLGRLQLAVPALAAGEQVRLVVTAHAIQRGVHRPGPAVLSSTAPFGLLRWSAPSDPATPLIVHPRTGQSRALQAEGAPTAADHSVAVAGSGTEVLGLRPFRQGDALRHLSARATARHGRPVVLERERETGPSLVVLATGGGAGAGWEQAVSSAASLALSALHDGRPPVLLADPAPLRLDATGVLDFFAAVDAAAPVRPEDLRAALSAAGPSGRLVLLAPPGAVEQIGRVRQAAAASGVRVEVLG